MLYFVTIVPFVLLGPMMLLFEPIAIMSYTGMATTLALLAANASATASTNLSASSVAQALTVASATPGLAPLPWSSAVEAACLALHGVFCASWSFHMVYGLLVVSPPTLQLVWLQSKVRLTATLGTSIAYAAGALSMQQSAHHVAWVFARTATVVWVCAGDAIRVSLRMRLLPNRGTNGWLFTKWKGSKRGHGPLELAVGTMLVGFAIADIFRHRALMFVSDERALIGLPLRNPVNGNHLALTNLQVVDGCFMMSVMFITTLLFTTLRRGALYTGTQSVLISTHYCFSNGPADGDRACLSALP